MMMHRRSILTALVATLTSLVLLTAVHAADLQAGIDAYKQGNFAKALREWLPLAEQGHVGAQTVLGFMYERGKGLPKDAAEAVTWYRKAAQQGHVEAAIQRGPRVRVGQGRAGRRR